MRFGSLRGIVPWMRNVYWELTEADAALREGNPGLAQRYIDKALEACRCMYCHGELDDQRQYRPHFKGVVHVDCALKYDGRGDYLSKNPEDRLTS